jgi:ribosomal protein S18 acetylase RimI-like enzyme
MNPAPEYRVNKASVAQLVRHLSLCDHDFVPPLSTRVDIGDYARKIFEKATRFEGWVNDALVGLVAAYCNDWESRIAYVTSVSVLREWTGKGVANCLMNRCIEHAKASGMRKISLDVASANTSAIRFYMKSGFVADDTKSLFVGMTINLEDR